MCEAAGGRHPASAQPPCKNIHDSRSDTFFRLRTSPAAGAFSSGFFAGARVRLGRSGRRRGPARAVPHALARGLDVEICDEYLRYLRGFPALSAF